MTFDMCEVNGSREIENVTGEVNIASDLDPGEITKFWEAKSN